VGHEERHLDVLGLTFATELMGAGPVHVLGPEGLDLVDYGDAENMDDMGNVGTMARSEPLGQQVVGVLERVPFTYVDRVFIDGPDGGRDQE